MNSIRLRFERSFFIRHALVGGISVFFGLALFLSLKSAGALVRSAGLLLPVPWVIVVLRERKISARVMDDEGVTRHDGRRFLWRDHQRLQEVYMKRVDQSPGPLNHVDLFFASGRVRILPLVLENGYQAIAFAKKRIAATRTASGFARKPGPDCPVCGTLKDYETGLQVAGREAEDSFLPETAARLVTVQERTRPAQTIKRCPECGSWFVFRSSYEFLVTGSEEEQTLDRISPEEAERLLGE